MRRQRWRVSLLRRRRPALVATASGIFWSAPRSHKFPWPAVAVLIAAWDIVLVIAAIAYAESKFDLSGKMRDWLGD